MIRHIIHGMRLKILEVSRYIQWALTDELNINTSTLNQSFHKCHNKNCETLIHFIKKIYPVLQPHKNLHLKKISWENQPTIDGFLLLGFLLRNQSIAWEIHYAKARTYLSWQKLSFRLGCYMYIANFSLVWTSCDNAQVCLTFYRPIAAHYPNSDFSW